MLQLVFLGKFRDLAPSALAAVDPPPEIVTLDDLREWVSEQTPVLGQALATMPFKLIVNNTIVHDFSARLRPGDEIAFMPPMSGG